MRDLEMFSDNKLYVEDIEYIYSAIDDWSSFSGKTFFITGATGLIGTVLVDALMYASIVKRHGIKVIALTRNTDNATRHFGPYLKDSDSCLRLVKGDVCTPIEVESEIDYIINLASNTHPGLYSAKPIETIESIVSGTKNVLDLAVKKNVNRVINASSVEVYGENRGDVERFSEDYCGYINCNTLRAGYPEGKRLAESLSQAYKAEKGVDVVSARIARVYGPTVLVSDRKAITQFIANAIKAEDVILKSEGLQRFSYIYVADVITGLLLLLTSGESGEAYNISGDEDIPLKDVAKVLAGINSREVVVDAQLVDGASVVQHALMDSKKMKDLQWSTRFNLAEGLARTVDIIRSKNAT